MIIGILLTVFVIFLCIKSGLAIKYPLLRLIIAFFVGLYGFQLVLAIWDPYKVYDISIPVIIAFNLQLVFFVLGAKTKLKESNYSDVVSTDFSWPKINIGIPMLIIITLLLYYTFKNYMKMQVAMVAFGEQTNLAREYYYKEFFSSYTAIVLHSIYMSFQYIAYFVSFTKLFSMDSKLKIKDIYFIVASVSVLVLSTLTSTGRADFLALVFVLIFFALVCKIYNQKSFKKRAIPLFGIAAGLFVVVLVITTLLRSNVTSVEKENFEMMFVKPFATYFYVPVLAFDFGKDTFLNIGHPLCGGAVLAGFWDFIISPFVYLDHSVMDLSVNSILGSRMTPSFDFPSGQGWNALFTGGANYYMDFWYFGFMLYPFLHGVIFKKLVFGMKKNMGYFIFLSYFFVCSYKHVLSLGIQSMEVVFVIIWIIVIRKFSLLK